MTHYTLGLNPLKPHYRPFCSYWWKHCLNPRTYWRFVKHFCQRGYRGYADCDSWDTNNYLEHVMIGVIKDLRDTTHGYPQSMSDYDMEEEHTAPDTGAERWRSALTEMVEGLEASIELGAESTVPEGVYSDEPLEWEELGNGLLRLKDSIKPRFNAEMYEAWALPLRGKRKRGALLMMKYWESLWD